MARILYFTAGHKATGGEISAINAINALAIAPYEVLVMNATASPAYGAGNIDGDYVAGTIPTAYNDAEVFPIFDHLNPPDQTNLIATQAIVSDTEVIVVKNSAGDVSKNGVAVVTSNNVDEVALAATEAIVSDTAAYVGITTGSYVDTVTVTVAGGLVTAIVLS